MELQLLPDSWCRRQYSSSHRHETHIPQEAKGHHPQDEHDKVQWKGIEAVSPRQEQTQGKEKTQAADGFGVGEVGVRSNAGPRDEMEEVAHEPEDDSSRYNLERAEDDRDDLGPGTYLDSRSLAVCVS